MAKEETIIIKKKKGGGHGGAHGGAWKVAYADFVTAMMCFFLVMWLMGSDDETKAAVSHYFNHPNTPWQQGRDPSSTSVHPMGEKEGSGENIVAGAAGLWPQDLIDRPKPVRDIMKEERTLALMLQDLLEGRIYGMDQNPRNIKFSLPEQLLFKSGTAELMPESYRELDILGELLKQFTGYVTIEGHTDDKPTVKGLYKSNWSLSLARAETVMNYLVQKHGHSETRLFPKGMGARQPLVPNSDPDARQKNRRVEFTLSYEQKFE